MIGLKVVGAIADALLWQMKMPRTAEAPQVPPLRLPERNVEKTNDRGGFTIASGAVLQLQVQMVLQLQVRMVVAMTVMPTA